MVDRGLKEVVRVTSSADGVKGEVALGLEPGTRSDEQREALDRVLVAPLTQAAHTLHVVLAARPSSFAFALPGKDAEGRARFVVRGRREGDRLIPDATGRSASKRHG